MDAQLHRIRFRREKSCLADRDCAPAAVARFLALLADPEAGRAPVVAAAAQAATHLVKQASVLLPPLPKTAMGLMTYVASNAGLAEPVRSALETNFIDSSPASRALQLS